MIALNSVIVGDAKHKLREVPSCSIQSIIADPPYYNVLAEAWDTQWKTVEDYIEWSLQWISESMRCLKEDGLCFIFGQLGKREHAFLHLMSESTKRFQYHDLIIWDRVVGYNERRDSLTPCYEMVLVLRKSEKVKFRKNRIRIPYDAKTIEKYLKDKRYKKKDARLKHLTAGKFATNIISVPSLKGSSKEKCGHPSQKPIDLVLKLILMSTDEGDVVLDPFLGSGTTAVAAAQQMRNWIGIEISAEYAEMARKRLSQSLSLSSACALSNSINVGVKECSGGEERTSECIPC